MSSPRQGEGGADGRLNPHVSYAAVAEPLLPATALAQLRGHALLLDCTDRPATRYLVCDAACALGVPLVSGAGIAALGQWSVYGPPGARACYRCVWPDAPAAAGAGASASCADTGVWGPAVGIVGAGMAADALALLLGRYEPGLKCLQLGGNPLVRTVRVRPPRAACPGCALLGRELDEHAPEYAHLCAVQPPTDTDGGDAPGAPGERVSAPQLAELLRRGGATVVDTRPPTEFAICALPGTTSACTRKDGTQADAQTCPSTTSSGGQRTCPATPAPRSRSCAAGGTTARSPPPRCAPRAGPRPTSAAASSPGAATSTPPSPCTDAALAQRSTPQRCMHAGGEVGWVLRTMRVASAQPPGRLRPERRINVCIYV